MNNPIRTLIYSRVKAMLAQSQGLKDVPHNLTKGQLREQLLIEFFTDILPDRYTVCSGFLADSYGTVSSQLDFIIAETADVPRLVLNREVSLVPVESARAIVEIKSSISIEDFRQVDAVLEQYQNFKTAYLAAQQAKQHPVHAYIIGFDTTVAEETMRDLMLSERKIAGCCVIGQYSLVRHELLNGNAPDDPHSRVEDNPEEDGYEGTLTFLACLYRDLAQIALNHLPYYPFAAKLGEQSPDLASLMFGKRWYWEAYVSEMLATAAEQRRPPDDG